MEREGILEHVREVGPYFGERLNDLAELPIVGNVRGLGLMRCVENVMNKMTREWFPDSVAIGNRISDAAEKAGVLVRPIGRLNVMSPPLVITKEEIDLVVSRLGRAIEQVQTELAREGLFAA